MISSPQPIDARFRAQLERLINENLESDSLDNAFLAKQLHLSEPTFYRMMKQHYDLSPNGLVRKIRLDHARKLLAENKVRTVRDAALSVGFIHTGYFIRKFEDQFGEKPATILKRPA